MINCVYPDINHFSSFPFSMDVKQHAQEEAKKCKRGIPPKKKIMYMDGKCSNFKSSAA